jgi:hypothetical protein
MEENLKFMGLKPVIIRNSNSFMVPNKGGRGWSSFLLGIAASIGGFGFLKIGFDSFFKANIGNFGTTCLLPFIPFIPQGVILVFYGTIGIIIGLFILWTFYWDVGWGYTLYEPDQKQITIHRTGFPGKNRTLHLVFPFKQLKAIKYITGERQGMTKQLDLSIRDGRQVFLMEINNAADLADIEVLVNFLANTLETGVELG